MNLNIATILFAALQKSMASDESQAADFAFAGGKCRDSELQLYDEIVINHISHVDMCKDECDNYRNNVLVGFQFLRGNAQCVCLFDNGYVETLDRAPNGAISKNSGMLGTGPIAGTHSTYNGVNLSDWGCMKNENFNPENNDLATTFYAVGGKCQDAHYQSYNWVSYPIANIDDCKAKCDEHSNTHLVGLEFVRGACTCLFDADFQTPPEDAVSAGLAGMSGRGSVAGTSYVVSKIGERWNPWRCFKNNNYSGPASFKLLPEDKEVIGRVKGLFRGTVEGTKADDSVPIVVV